MGAMKDRLQAGRITYPQVIIDEFVQKISGDDFKDPVLRDLFREPVKINRKPLIIIKFSEDSSFKKIAPHIFNTLMARSVSGLTTFTTRELTENSLEEIWNNLDKDFQKSLNEKVRGFLNRCRTHELRPYLSKREDKWKIKINDHWNSRKKFSDDCNRLMDNLEENLEQKMIWDF